MKIIKKLFLTLASLFIVNFLFAQYYPYKGQVSIYGAAGGLSVTDNATGTKDASSVLDLSSTSKGFLAPRMTQAQRNAIVSPASGLMVYQTDGAAGFYVYGGAAWGSIASNTAWSLTGNAGTNASTNFIGTTDSVSLEFRINNIRRGIIDVNQNVSWGISTLKNNISGSNNYVTGRFSLLNNTTGSDNVGLGCEILYNNQIGAFNVALGHNNLHSNLSGNNNTALGGFALFSNTTGSNNLALGDSALYSNQTASNLIGIGQGALKNAINSPNIAVGYQADYHCTTGIGNVAFGYQAQYMNEVGTNNTAIGRQALFNNKASNNVAISYQSLYANETGSNNFAAGYQSMNHHKSGDNNTAIGFSSLHKDTTGINNTAIGAYALYNSANNSDNVAIGYQAQYNSALGESNISIGKQTLYSNVVGSYNTAIGNESMLNTLTYENTAVGFYSLHDNISGDKNTAIGDSVLWSNVTGYGNTAIGSHANVSSGSLDNSTALGHDAIITQSNQVVLGDAFVTQLKCAAAYAGTSAALPNLVVDGSGVIARSTTPITAGWSLTGNAGTDTSINFIGTTDSTDFILKTNNTNRFSATADGNIFIGSTAMTGNAYIEVQNNYGLENGILLHLGEGGYGISDSIGNNLFAIQPNIFEFFIGDLDGIGNSTYIHIEDNLSEIGFNADTSIFNGGIKMIDGTEGLGKVLTSSSTGMATWQDVTTSAWGLTGNAGTDATNFIGTTDSAAFFIRNPSNSNIDASVTIDAYSRQNVGFKVIGNSVGDYGVQILGTSTTGTASYIGGVSTNDAVQLDGVSTDGAAIFLTGNSTNGSDIWLASTNGKIKITGIGEGVGKVLTSDATGMATWQNPYIQDSLTTQAEASAIDSAAYIDLPNGISGWGDVYLYNEGVLNEYAHFAISFDGTALLIYNSANAVNSNTGGNLCFIDNGTNVRIKNNVGNGRTIKLEVKY